jgi:hypothetical protein
MGSQAYVNLIPSTIDVRIANNIFNPDLSTIEFSDPVAGNYDLKAISPAVNTGSDIDGFLLTFDLLNRVRPFAGIKDIGALECSDSSLLGIGSPADHDPYSLVVVPNPFGEYITLVFNLKERTEVEVAICDLEGEKVGIPVKTQYGPGNYTITINAKLYEPGFYILIFRTRDTVRSKKLIKLH